MPCGTLNWRSQAFPPRDSKPKPIQFVCRPEKSSRSAGCGLIVTVRCSVKSKNCEATVEIQNAESRIRHPYLACGHAPSASAHAPSTFWEILLRLIVLGLALLCIALVARACGPDFPN